MQGEGYFIKQFKTEIQLFVTESMYCLTSFV